VVYFNQSGAPIELEMNADIVVYRLSKTTIDVYKNIGHLFTLIVYLIER
jgi:hypothetical protein